jgi:DNA-binding CsgD family transcriptional regulator
MKEIELDEFEKTYIETLLQGKTFTEQKEVLFGEYRLRKTMNSLFQKFEADTKVEFVIKYLKWLNPNMITEVSYEQVSTNFTQLQVMVISELVKGKTFKQIAYETGKSYRTVNNAIERMKGRIYYKFESENFTYIVVIVHWLKILNRNLRLRNW